MGESNGPDLILSSDVSTLQDEVMSSRREIAALHERIDVVSHRLRVEEWRHSAREVRRYRRAIAVLERASSWRDWLLAPFRMLRELMTSQPSPPRPAPLEKANRSPWAARIAAATEAFERGEDEPALSLARELAPLVAGDDEVWRFVRRVLIRTGNISEHLRAVRDRRRTDDSRPLRLGERKELGRHRELDLRWFPHLPGTGTYDPEPGRVLHVLKESAPYLTNGYTMRSAYTVWSQREAGLDPFVVTSLGFPRSVVPADEFDADDHLRTDEVMGVRHHRLDLGPTYPHGRVPWDRLVEDALLAIQPVVERERPELVQAGSGFRGFETAMLGRAVARRYGLPFIYEVRSFLEHTWTGELDRAEHGEHFAARSAREVQLMMEADHVITIAEAMKRDLVGRGVPDDHVTVVPNGVDTTAFVPRPFDPALAATLGLVPGVPVVGYVSNLGQREGLEVLVEAVLRLRRSGVSVQGLIIGEGPMRADLEAMLAGDPTAVLLPGRVPHEQIQEHYCLMDLFVIPRLDDRAARLVTPLKPFEAMALERPMVVSDLPALREITAPPDRGAVFAVGSASDLATRLRELLEDPQRRRALGAAGRRWVTDERDWRMNGPRYREVYDMVTERHSNVG